MLAQVVVPNQGPNPRLAQNRPGRGLIVGRGGDDDSLVMEGVFLPPDRSAKRRLEMAEDMIRQRRFGEGVRLLGALLEDSEDFFFKPEPTVPVFRSLKAEAGRLIATLPSDGRESYELQYGARAAQLLRQAVERGSAAELADVARQFFYTEAGQDATFLLGRHHLDHDRPVAAALCFQRLVETRAARDRLEPVLSLSLATSWLRAGNPDQEKSALLRLKRQNPGARVDVAGKSVRLFEDDADAVVWMRDTFGPLQSPGRGAAEQWALFRGDASRNARSEGSRPLLNVRWRQRTCDDRQVEKFVNKVRQDYLSQEIVAIPSFHPLAIDDVVIMRTAFALQAIDLETGKLVWRYAETDGSLNQFLEVGSSPQPGRSVQVLSGLDQRMWEDSVYGTLSSDGDNVYYVEDLGLGVTGSPLTTVLPNGRRVMVNSRSTNRLAARELRTQGKLKWEVGGIDGGDEPELAEAFFLGPPLPLLGELFALAEFKGQEIRLVVLDPGTGKLTWSQQIAVVDPPVTQDSYRRNAGATPSFANGVLVCPTSAGAVVAIDLTTRSLLWGYQYPRFQQEQRGRNVQRFGGYPGSERHENEHWIDGSITIADRRVLVTPIESDQIYCLDLTTGEEIWKRDRENGIYVACVHEGSAILVGRDEITALSLADGQPAWPKLALPDGSMPSGRGFYSGEHYYLPLSTAEVAKVELGTGQILERARSRNGSVPGNLICYEDTVVSQSVEHVDAYYQLDALTRNIRERLADHPDDPEALTSLAAGKLDAGSLDEATELLRRAYKLESKDTSRERLVQVLLEGLRVDFEAHRDSVEEIESLIERREHRLVFLRVLAAGLQASGEILPAFEAYLALIDEDAPLALDEIDDSLSVQRGRWISAQLDILRETATTEQRDQIDSSIVARMRAALDADSTDALRKFIDVFGTNPNTVAARVALVARLGSDDLLECESHVRQIDASAWPAEAVAVRKHLVALLEQADRHDLAAVYYQQLGDQLADVAGPDGTTGKQIVDALAGESPVRSALDDDAQWPSGKVSVRQSTVAPRPRTHNAPRSADLDIVGPADPFFSDLTVSLDLQTQVLVGSDGYGRRRFRIPIYERRSQPVSMNRFNVYNAPPLSYVSVNGGLLVLSMSNRVIAIDTMRGGPQEPSRIQWVEELGDRVGGYQTGQGIYSRPVAVPWGGTRHVPEDTYGRRYGNIGPVTDKGVFFQRLRDLHCVDPLTGRTVWVRKNVGLGNQLFGDDELLFVAPAGDEETLVLRAATGEQLGTRKIVPFEQRMLTIGRRVLCWQPKGGQQRISLQDPWDDRTLWSFEFANGSKAAMVDQQAVAVLQPDGQFTLIELADGKPLIRERLEPEKSLIGIHLLRSDGQYLLITNSAARLETSSDVHPAASTAGYPRVNGRVYAFDASTGERAWAAPTPVPQYDLVTNQPSRLPLLVFVRQVQRRRSSGRREANTSVLCIDKRSGKVVFQNDALPTTMLAGLELSGDPTSDTVTLALPPKVIELTLTNEPVDGASDSVPDTADEEPNEPAPDEPVE